MVFQYLTKGGEGKSAAEVLPERASQETVAFSSSKKVWYRFLLREW